MVRHCKTMAPDEDHERLADDLDQETDKLAGQSDRLADEIEHVRADWHSKQEDEGVPGAAKPSDPAASAVEPSDEPDASGDPPGRRSST
ncbi:MAG: hypothetical protein ACR2MK_08150 [Solirubrobacteraceae bacterium]